MIIQKYAHACFSVTKDDKTLVVDPGNWSPDFVTPTNIVAVVITHEHADHFDHDKLRAIAEQNPEAILIAHESITSQVTELATQSVTANDTISVGPFTLSFLGGDHATVYEGFPHVTNLGVMINHMLYYPGDSFAIPDQPVDTLALPASAPWMKISEAMDFCKTINARFVFPTHDAILSEAGKSLADKLLGSVANSYLRLSGPLEIDG